MKVKNIVKVANIIVSHAYDKMEQAQSELKDWNVNKKDVDLDMLSSELADASDLLSLADCLIEKELLDFGNEYDKLDTLPRDQIIEELSDEFTHNFIEHFFAECGVNLSLV